MITQFFGENIFGKLIKTGANSVQLQAGSRLRVGGLGLRLDSALNIDTTTNGLGGLDTGSQQAGKLYYVYAVITGSSFGLVASLSEISPTGFLLYRKVGAFTTDYLSNEVNQTISGSGGSQKIVLKTTMFSDSVVGSTGSLTPITNYGTISQKGDDLIDGPTSGIFSILDDDVKVSLSLTGTNSDAGANITAQIDRGSGFVTESGQVISVNTASTNNWCHVCLSEVKLNQGNQIRVNLFRIDDDLSFNLTAKKEIEINF